MNKTFIIKFALFMLSALICPCVYLIIRFSLFSQTSAITIWGVVIIAILLIVVFVLIKYYLDGIKTRYSYFKQILVGFVKVILPILIVLLVVIFVKIKLDWIKANINVVIEALSVILGCEMVAIAINPLPKWAFDNNVEGLGEIADKILKKGD